MAVEEYRRRLEIHKKKLAFGQDLLEVVKQSSTLKELQDSSTVVQKMAEKIGKVEELGREMKQAVVEKKREMEEEMRSEFVAATGQEREPDIVTLKNEVESVNRQVREKEKNCRKLIKEREQLDHDRKYHKVLKGIAPIHFDKNSTDSHVKGYIKKTDGELDVFEYDLGKENKCSVADSLWEKF